MAKSYVVGFEAVELVDGLAEDQPVWLYMRATLYNDGDPDHPVWFGDVGSLPPDANRPAPDGYPVGDAGRYADHLIVGTEVSHSSPLNVPQFSVGPVVVDSGQTLEVLIFMLPKVWFETKSVSPDDLDRTGFGLLGFAVGAGGFGIVGGVVGAILGAFAPRDHDVQVPCFNTVISARQVFTSADLDAMESKGRLRFGPMDNEASVLCHQPIDSYYWLSANNAGFRFATTPEPTKEVCTLEPRAYEPAEDQLRGAWGDVGDRYTDCLMVAIQISRPGYANVFVSRGPGAGFATVAQFSDVRIERATPQPDFQRNVYDDDCPARSVHPDCPECLRFANLSTSMTIHPHLLLLGVQPGSHFGTRPPFPLKLDTDRISLPRAGECGECVTHKAAADKAPPKRAAKKAATADVGLTDRRVTRDRFEVVRLNSQWNAAVLDTGHIRLSPNGGPPLKQGNVVVSGLDEHTLGWLPLPPELGISWILKCSQEFRLATYQEIHGDRGCIGRLRYTRYNADGVIVADLMLSRLPAPVN